MYEKVAKSKGRKIHQNANKLQSIENNRIMESGIIILTKQSAPFSVHIKPLFVNNVISGSQTHIQGIRSITSSMKPSLAHQFSSLVTPSHPPKGKASFYEADILILNMETIRNINNAIIYLYSCKELTLYLRYCVILYIFRDDSTYCNNWSGYWYCIRETLELFLTKKAAIMHRIFVHRRKLTDHSPLMKDHSNCKDESTILFII